MNRFEKFDKELIRKLVSESISLTMVCLKLNISTGGYSTNSLKEYLDTYKIDYSHFTSKQRLTKEQYNSNPKLCKNCGKPLEWDKHKNDFCSPSCSTSYNNLNRYLSKLDLISDDEFKNIINTSCTWNEILLRIGYSTSSNSEIKLKIKERANKLLLNLNIKQNLTKDWSKITKELLFLYCKNWQSARTQIRKLAQKVFNNNNNEYKCIICGYDKHVEIAHIKAVSDFDRTATIAEINDSSNLISLCPNHHWEYDNGLLDLKLYIARSPGGSSVS